MNKKINQEIKSPKFPSARVGDIFFLSGRGFVSRSIECFTGGPVSHVGLVYDGGRGIAFETDGKWGRAAFHDLSQYCMEIAEGRMEFFRYRNYTPEMLNKIRDLCKKFNGTPYSYWDCFANAITAWLPAWIRRPVVGLLGTKKFCKCDEMTMMIVYKATGYAPFACYEQNTPNSLYRLVAEMPQSRNWDRVDYWNGVVK